MLPDDTTSGGNWMGRYGEFAWILCGMSGLWDHSGGKGVLKSGDDKGGRYFHYRGYIGENCDAGDAIRAWVHWPYLPESIPERLSQAERKRIRGPLGKLMPAGMDLWDWGDMRRVLQNPVNGGRRQSSWDDHAEAYAPWFSRKGPHIYIDLDFPEGDHVISFYFVNKDSHWGGVNRFRDYWLHLKDSSFSPNRHTGWEKAFESAPTLARTRIHDFYCGVYKRFFVRGPSKLTARIGKGDSINAIVSGIFVDRWVNNSYKMWTANVKAQKPNIVETLIAFKAQAPETFVNNIPMMVGLFGRSMGQSGEGMKADLANLESLIALFDVLMEFEARDAVFKKYASTMAEWVKAASKLQLADRVIEFRDRCSKARSHPGLSRSQVAELHQVFFETVLSAVDEWESTNEARHFAIKNAIGHPHLSRAALLSLWQYYKRNGQSKLERAFSADEMLAWAQCHRQLGKHVVASRAFEKFLAMYPKHPSASFAADRIRYERMAASDELRARRQEFRTMEMMPRPGIERPKRRVKKPAKDLPKPPAVLDTDEVSEIEIE
ncbi:MAG: hypothetical protein QF473_05890 [Planctomycetota bacterium]|nr:hypothetical protein [Planctomycetota bacterium]